MTAPADSPLFSCQCFGPGLPPQGRQTHAEIQQDQLVFTIDGRLVRLPWKTCKVAVSAANDQQLILSWRGGGGDWKVISNDDDAFASILENAPQHLQQQLERWRQGVSAVGWRFPLSISPRALALAAATLAIVVVALLVLREQLG